MSRNLVVAEEEAYELLAHLISSADICTFEPHYYGTFRLLDAASRLMELMLKHGAGEDDPWLNEFKAEVDEHKIYMMTDRERYFAFLQEATKKLARELKRRDATAAGTEGGRHSVEDRS